MEKWNKILLYSVLFLFVFSFSAVGTNKKRSLTDYWWN